MAFYSKRLMDSMSTSSYANTPKTTVMEAWELFNSSAASNNSVMWSKTQSLVPFNKEDFTKNAEVSYSSFILYKLKYILLAP